LQTSLEDIEAAFVVQLPEVDATDEETLDAAEYDVEQAMQQAHNILADAEYWLDTFRAPREVANKYRIAYMSTDRSAVAEGGLVSMSANFPVLYEQAATYVDRILKGASPAILPVEQPSKFQVTVNNKTAQALGLSIPPAVRRQHGRLQRVRSKKGSQRCPCSSCLVCCVRVPKYVKSASGHWTFIAAEAMCALHAKADIQGPQI
ncbi:MAG: ABC transporter substrate binding protein, partial [Pseudolabrys sp.]